MREVVTPESEEHTPNDLKTEWVEVENWSEIVRKALSKND